MNARNSVVAFLLITFTGCASAGERPSGLTCPADVLYELEAPHVAAVTGAASPYADMLRSAMESRPALEAVLGGPAFVAFSGGGQWGAFGAGFVAGWGESEDLPEFNVVTGVSTGALIAPLVFIGPDRIDDLKNAYTIDRQSDLVTERGKLSILLGANSLLKRDGLVARLDALVDDDFLADVAAASNGGRRALLIGVVNADDGGFYAVDLAALARRQLGDCFRAFLLASTSVPVVFQPVFVNDTMYVDGGARQLVFFRETFNALAALEEVADASLTIVIDGDLTVPNVKLGNSLLSIADRSSSIIVDQVGQDSLDRLLRLADERGWVGRYTTARGASHDGIKCEIAEGAKDTTFNPAFMACLMGYGADRWSDGRPWD